MLKRLIRTAARGMRLAAALLLAGGDYLFTIRLARRSGSIQARARWMQRQSRRLLRALGIEAEYDGEPPGEGVLVSNHVSYTDILVLGARHPLVFVSKAEVAGWPVFGFLTGLAGTLFLRRQDRGDVLRLARKMPAVLEAGVVLSFFPEGTSSDGLGVLPFHSPLLAPAIENGWKVTPAALHYELPPGEGLVEEDVAYWGEMEFGPHLLHLLGRRRIRAVVAYGQPVEAGRDRKALAARLHGAVSDALRRRKGGTLNAHGRSPARQGAAPALYAPVARPSEKPTPR